MDSSAVLIINPASGAYSEKKLQAAAALLQGHYSDVTLRYTRKSGDAEELAREAARESPAVIVAAGGDGTFNEVANGAAFSKVPLAFLPMGTTNVLARELSIPEDINAAVSMIIKGTWEDINLGSIDDRHFVLMAGIGFDGESVYGLNQQIKSFSGKGAYILSGIMTIVRYNPELLHITIDGRSDEGYGLIVCNGRFYAGGFHVCPDASLKSDELSVFIMHGNRRKELLQHIFRVAAGGVPGHHGVTYRSGKHIRISGKAHTQVDGDYYGKTPAEIRIRKDALRVIKYTK